MLSERIAAFVRAPEAAGEGAFEGLVREAFALHWAESPPVRRLADAAGVTPESLGDWRQVPMVPALAFKTQRLGIGEAREVFHSSGTTGAGPSVHHHPYPELYRAVIDATFPGACLGGVGGLSRPPMLSLVPSREEAPRSSLAFMIDHVLRRWGGEGSRVAAAGRGLRAGEARGFLAARQRDRRPAVVLGTAFSLVQLLEALERLGLAFRLPAGSVVFETGGYKGRSRELPRAELEAAMGRRLGVAPTAIVREYGMTELTSHFYARASAAGPTAGPGPFLAPPWVRFRILDPATLEESAGAAPGLLAIFDLANVGSALHVLTEDLAVADGGGFRLAGRAAGAELRGCSLLSEEMAG
ncbi:MAG: acyl-protein synthetase [Acidobacteriota bacterium]|nr:acyl-protein synthetase [Acidobacteriota bacterium]